MSSPSDEAAAARADAARSSRLARSTAIFSLATGLSRVLGLVREIVARYYFGTVGAINAFEVAFLIPNTVRALVADAALSSAFVPVFSELLEKGERKRAWRVASSLFWLVLLGLGGLTALFILIAPWVMRAFGYGDLAVGLSRVLFPIVVLLGLSGIVVGILNSYEHFSVPALTPVFWNVAIIAGLLIGIPHVNGTDHELYVYAVSILIATVIQFLLPIPWLRGRDGRLHVVIDWRDPAVRRTLTLMVPITIGLGLINFNAVVDTFFAARLIDRDHAPSAINAAFRLYMLPQGMFSVAVATVLFPSLARLATRADLDGFRRTVGAGIRQIAFLLVPASVVCAVLADPIVRVVYQRGDFTADQTPATAGALAAFALGLSFNGFMLMLNRAFFSLQSPWIPTWVALGNLVLNAALDGALYSVGIWGLPFATSLVNIAGSAALLVLLRRRLERIELTETTRTVARVTLASLVLAGVAYGLWTGLDHGLGDSFGAALFSLLVALAGGLAAYLVACRALGVRELEALLSLRRRRAAPA
ncbi:MAG TPA: murein biosynthesis integral membrane protein MurJ [Gaiellaceae bacterium]|nr:murein biosynthesis integral membrane protein MurJ [Gaiellaceae bacterium]